MQLRRTQLAVPIAETHPVVVDALHEIIPLLRMECIYYILMNNNKKFQSGNSGLKILHMYATVYVAKWIHQKLRYYVYA